MTLHNTTFDYQTSMIEAIPFDFDLESYNFAGWPAITYTENYSIELIGEMFVSETACTPFENVALSLPTLSPAYKLLRQLTTLQGMSEDDHWPGAVRPNAQAFEDAKFFIRRSTLNAVPMPDVGLADDGEINFLWDSDGVHVDLGFYGTGTFSYFARGNRGQRIHGEDEPASGGLPRQVILLFSD